MEHVALARRPVGAYRYPEATPNPSVRHPASPPALGPAPIERTVPHVRYVCVGDRLSGASVFLLSTPAEHSHRDPVVTLVAAAPKKLVRVSTLIRTDAEQLLAPGSSAMASTHAP